MAQLTDIGVVAVVKNFGNFNAQLSTIRQQMGLTGRSSQTMAKNFNSSFSGVGQSILNTGRTVRAFGNELTFLGFQLTFLATGAFALVTAKGAEFEDTIVRMSTLANVATQDLGGIASAMQRLAVTVGATPTDLADAFFDIVSSGFDAAEAMTIIETTAKGAALGLGTVREVTDAVTSAMRTWADEGLTAARATDILVQAVREGKGEVDRLAGTIGRVLGVAELLGVSFEEVAAFISTFTRVGVPVEVAVTSLRAALTNLVKPTAAATTALEKFDLTMDDIKKIIDEQGLAAGLITLARVLGDDEEAFSKVIGSARGLAGVLINTGPLLSDYRQVLESIGASAGVTEEAFDLFAQTTTFRANAAKAAFESLFITLSNVLRPLVNFLLDQVPKITLALEELIQTNPKLFLLAGAFALVVAAIGPLLIIVGLMITAFGTAISVLGAFVSAVGFVVGALGPAGPLIAGLVLVASTLTGLFVASFEKTNAKLGEQGRAISFNAYAWGRNVIISFARGMAEAAVFVIQVLTQIGQIITYWLQSLSPPRLLPDIDDWGTGAMEAWMEGWLNADFSIFQSLAGTLESFLRTIGLPDIDVVPAIMNLRTGLAGLIETFRQTGVVSTEAINAIAAGFGSAGAVVAQYIQAMLDVEAQTMAVAAAQEVLTEAQAALTAAQENLNAVQEKYSELLKPINKELDAIARRRQEVIDDMRIAELEAILADPNAPALAKELAAMELREIALKREEQAIMDAQAAEEEKAQAAIDSAQEVVDEAQAGLDLAQEELRLAQERADAARQLVQIQQQNNSLLQEQLSLLERLGESLGGIGGAGLEELEEELGGVGDIISGAGDAAEEAARKMEEFDMLMRKLGGPGGPDDLGFGEGLGSIEDMFGDITTAAQDLVTTFTGIGTEIAEAWKPVTEAGEELTDVWSDIFSFDFSNFENTRIAGTIRDISKAIDEFLTRSGIREFMGTTNPFTAAQEAISELLPNFVLLGVAGLVFAGATERLLEAWDGLAARLGSFVKDSDLTGVTEDFDTLREVVDLFLVPLKGRVKFVLFLGTALLFAATQAVIFATNIVIAIDDMIRMFFIAETNARIFRDKVLGVIREFFAEMGRQLEEGWEKFVGFFTGGTDKSEKRVSRMSKNIAGDGGIIPTLVNLIVGEGGLIPGLFNKLVGEDGLFPGIGLLATAAFQTMSDAIVFILDGEGGLIPTVQGAFDALKTWVADQVEAFRQVGRDIGQGLLDGIQEKVQPLIDFIGGLLNQLAEYAGVVIESDSPSKVFMRIGNDMIDGLILGMGQRATGAMSAMQGIMAMTAQSAMVAPHSAPAVYNNQSRDSNFGPINIYNGVDMAALRVLIRQEMNGSM